MDAAFECQSNFLLQVAHLNTKIAEDNQELAMSQESKKELELRLVTAEGKHAETEREVLSLQEALGKTSAALVGV